MSRNTRFRDDVLLGIAFVCAGAVAGYYQLTPLLSVGLILAGIGAIASGYYAKGRDAQDVPGSRGMNLILFVMFSGLGVAFAGGGLAVMNAGYSPLAGYVLWGLGAIFGLLALAGVTLDLDSSTTTTADGSADRSPSRTSETDASMQSTTASKPTDTGDTPTTGTAAGQPLEQRVQQHHKKALAALKEERLDDAEAAITEAATAWTEAGSEPDTATQRRHSTLQDALEERRATGESDDPIPDVEQATEDTNSQAEQTQHDGDQEAQETVPDEIVSEFDGALKEVRSDLSRAETAVERSNYELAERQIGSARSSLADAGELTEAHGIQRAETLDRYETELAELEETIERARAELEEATKSFSGMLGSIGAGLSKADEYIDTGEFTRAETRIDSVEETLNRARTLNQDHELGREDALAERRQRVDALRDTIAGEENAFLRELLHDAETAVESGIAHRDNQAYTDAVEEFSDAVEQYTRAVELVTDRDRPEAWEVEERHSMVTEYLERTEEELADRRRAVHHDLTDALEAAEEHLTRAEQFVEVDDTGSARDVLEDGVRNLDQAAQLIATGVADVSFQDRAEELVAKAETLHAELPEIGDTTEYRTQDLVQYLQQLTAKLTESPRPDLLNEYGEYSADAYLDAFGSWPEALAAANLEPVDEAARERRKYTRTEVLDAIAALWDDLGHPPDQAEMSKQGRMSASPVSTRFTSWEAAIDVVDAARTRRAEQARTPADEPAPASTESSPEAMAADTDGTATEANTAEEESSDEGDIVSQLLEDMGFDGKHSASD